MYACLLLALLIGMSVMPTALTARTLQYDDGTVDYSSTLGDVGDWKEFAVLFDMPYNGHATLASVMYQSQIASDFSVQFYSAVPNQAASEPALVPGAPISDSYHFTSSILTTPAWEVLSVDVELMQGPFFLVFRYPHQFVPNSNLYLTNGIWSDYSTELSRYVYRTQENPLWGYSYNKYMFRVEIPEARWSPVVIQPLARTQLETVLAQWEDLSGRLQDEPTDDMAALIAQIQAHVANAAQLTNPVYAAGQLSKALELMEELAALLA